LVGRLTRTESRDAQYSNPAAESSVRRQSNKEKGEPEGGRDLKAQRRSDNNRQSRSADADSIPEHTHTDEDV
ncbi:MAG: hypothetical protein K6T68_06215, partial [Alicyclobacillus shizuokensis]|nr:hypothetical protein [Alicyclobacillus shizuokensis]